MTQDPQPRPRHRLSRSLPAAMLGGLGLAATLAGLASALIAGEPGGDASGRTPTIFSVHTAAATPAATATPCDDSADRIEGFIRDGLAGTLDGCTGAFVPYTPTPVPTPEPPASAPPAPTLAPAPPVPPVPTVAPTPEPTEAPHVHI